MSDKASSMSKEKDCSVLAEFLFSCYMKAMSLDLVSIDEAHL